MKTLYIECVMGAAGDMLAAALAELCGETFDLAARLNALNIPGVRVSAAPSVKCGIRGTHMTVTVHGDTEHDDMAHNGTDHHHNHNALADIEALISALALSPPVKQNALAVYRLLADAESHVHGVPMTDIHFHEVGSMDAVADIVGVCMLMEEIAPEWVVVSPVNVGGGTVRCAHGILPVPAPATARLLRSVPVYGGTVSSELCTPTGAALLTHFANSFGAMPAMRLGQIGYGMGTKDFDSANCVRVFLGDCAEDADGPNGQAAELKCNVDDMTGEELGYACRLLLREGALETFVTPVQMKKDRPGQLLTLLCEAAEANRFAKLLLRHTTTFGVRKTLCERYMLRRDSAKADTAFGIVRVKHGCGYGVCKRKPEYEDIAAAAERAGAAFKQVADSARQAAGEGKANGDI